MFVPLVAGIANFDRVRPGLLEGVRDPPFALSRRPPHIMVSGRDRRRCVFVGEVFHWETERYVVLDDDVRPTLARTLLSQEKRVVACADPWLLVQAIFEGAARSALARAAALPLIVIIALCIALSWLPTGVAFAPAFALRKRDLQAQHLAATLVSIPRVGARSPHGIQRTKGDR